MYEYYAENDSSSSMAYGCSIIWHPASVTEICWNVFANNFSVQSETQHLSQKLNAMQNDASRMWIIIF